MHHNAGGGRIHPFSPPYSGFLQLMGTREPPSQPRLSSQAVVQSLTGCCEQAVAVTEGGGCKGGTSPSVVQTQGSSVSKHLNR